MKKKSPVPTQTPAKAPAPPAKQPVPPQQQPQKPPAPAEKGKDYSETPLSERLTVPKLQLDPELFPGADDLAGPRAPNFLKPIPGSGDQIDWLEMRRPFLTRGVMLDERGLLDIEQNWRFTFSSLTAWGFSPELAVKIANIGTPIAYDFYLANENPNAEERMNQSLEKMLPPGQKLPTKIVVPIITPDTLQWVTKKITGKDIDFRF